MTDQIKSPGKSVFSTGMRLTARRPERHTASRREIDAHLDALELRCARGLHPQGEGARETRSGVEFCCACGRKVLP